MVCVLERQKERVCEREEERKRGEAGRESESDSVSLWTWILGDTHHTLHQSESPTAHWLSRTRYINMVTYSILF